MTEGAFDRRSCPPGVVVQDAEGRWSLAALGVRAGRVRERLAPVPARRVGIATRHAGRLVALAWGALLAGKQPVLLDPAGVPAETGPSEFPVDVLVTDDQRSWEEEATGGTRAAPRGGLRGSWQICFLTSGSTGRPKLVAKRLEQLGRQLEHEVPVLGVRPRSRLLLLVPPFHILGFLYGIALSFFLGGEARFVRGDAPFAWLRTIRKWEPDLVVGVPFHFRVLAELPAAGLPPATYLCSGGPLSPRTDRAFAGRTGRRILQVYGSTETGGIATRSGERPWEPLPGLEWRVDPRSGRLQVRSPWQDDPRSWYVTDDLASPAGDGFVLRGRADSIVKIGGRRVSTEAIRRAVLDALGVSEAAVVPYRRGEELGLALFVETGPGDHPPDPRAIRRHLARALGPALVPRTIRLLSRLPRLGTGKVDLQALRAQLGAADR